MKYFIQNLSSAPAVVRGTAYKVGSTEIDKATWETVSKYGTGVRGVFPATIAEPGDDKTETKVDKK